MRIAVVSDTHMHSPDDVLAYAFENYLRQADILFHCGDFTSAAVPDYLASHPWFVGIRGNCDHFPGSENLPLTRQMRLDGLLLGAAHGWGKRFEVGENVAESFGPGFDLIFYGHTHERFKGKSKNGAMLVNPGAFFSPKAGPPSLALVDTSPALTVRFIDLN
jgi:hypothetical protein